MALRDWTRKVEFEAGPPAKIAKMLFYDEPEPQNSKIAKIAGHEPQERKPAPSPPEPVRGDWYDDRICEVIDDLAGVQMMEYPEHVRDQARALFDEFSEAAAQGDDARFERLLREWKAVWLSNCK